MSMTTVEILRYVDLLHREARRGQSHLLSLPYAELSLPRVKNATHFVRSVMEGLTELKSKLEQPQ